MSETRIDMSSTGIARVDVTLPPGNDRLARRLEALARSGAIRGGRNEGRLGVLLPDGPGHWFIPEGATLSGHEAARLRRVLDRLER